MHTHLAALLALITGVSSAMGGTGPADDATINELRTMVSDLQKQVETLQAQNGDNWLSEQRANEIRGLVHDVLADADTRASLLQSGAVAGYDKNFFIGSADGNYLMKISGQMQIRAVYNFQDEASGDSDRFGFENRRTKVKFAGHVVDPSWQYAVQGAFERDGGSFVLEDAFVEKDFGNGWSLRFGQFKPPFLREALVSSTKQMFVERSLVNSEFHQDRAQGVELAFEGEQFRGALMYSDGFFPGGAGTDNTGWSMEDTEFAFTGRVEFLASGEWKQFDDFQGWRGGDTGILFGAAAHYQDGEFGTPSIETEFLGLTGDVSVEFDGIGLYGAIVYRNLEPNLPGATDVDQIGFVVQGGVFVSEDVELFARYEWGDFDTGGVEDLSVVTVGFTKFYSKHNLKWTNDVGFALDEVASVWSTSSAGYRTDAPDEDGQVVLRSQFQLLF